MDLESFYARLLKLVSPWHVKAVVYEEGIEHVNVYVEPLPDARFPCPECGKYCAVSGYGEKRSLRHFNSCHAATYVHAAFPVIHCDAHGEQNARPPESLADPDLTVEFRRWCAMLEKEVGVKNVALLSGLDRRLDTFIRGGKSPAKARRGKRSKSSGGDEPQSQPARQLGLFSQNDRTFLDQGVRALRDLRFQDALDLFEKHRAVYPKAENADSKTAFAAFLLRGFAEAPSALLDRPAYFCSLWKSLEEHSGFKDMRPARLMPEVKRACFERMIEELDQGGAAGAPLLPGGVPTGRLHLLAGKYDRAAASLQACIREAPHNAAVWGYLGDAHFLCGKLRLARQCYRDACLLGPEGVDWGALKDEALLDLRQDIAFLYDFDDGLALAWLPSHARISGLFERKEVSLNEGLEEMVEEYLAIQANEGGENLIPYRSAKLFFRGILLCDNERSLGFVKKIHLGMIRKAMRQANPKLFAEYLEGISGAAV